MAAGGESPEDTLDRQVVADAIQSTLVLLGNASTHFSMYRQTKVLEEFNKDLVSFAEEKAPELRGLAPQLYFRRLRLTYQWCWP